MTLSETVDAYGRVPLSETRASSQAVVGSTTPPSMPDTNVQVGMKTRDSEASPEPEMETTDMDIKTEMKEASPKLGQPLTKRGAPGFGVGLTSSRVTRCQKTMEAAQALCLFSERTTLNVKAWRTTSDVNWEPDRPYTSYGGGRYLPGIAKNIQRNMTTVRLPKGIKMLPGAENFIRQHAKYNTAASRQLHRILPGFSDNQNDRMDRLPTMHASSASAMNSSRVRRCVTYRNVIRAIDGHKGGAEHRV